MIRFKNYVKEYKNFKLGPIDVEIERGKTTAVLGVSGSGKSLLINSIIGGIKKFRGDLMIDEKSRRRRGSYQLNSLISFYTQLDFSLYELSGFQLLRTMAIVLNIPKREIDESVKYWMEYFALWHARDVKVRDYSWGMKNRLNLIICFLKRAEIIIMDEPGSNLDSKWRKKVSMLISDLKANKKTVILTSHNIDEVVELIDNYIIIDGGKVLFQGSAEQLNVYKKYKLYANEPFDIEKVEEFMKSRNLKLFKYYEEDNAILFSVNNLIDINWVFLFFVKQGVPVSNIEKVPVNMEAIFKAVADSYNQNSDMAKQIKETAKDEEV